ncbi:RteC domain-containing protein [Chryseobacterium sp. G0162]|uniref:RteC domain-containing protein n=1 Tax=Chryseobacterium sp. G0162 TaxID=2487063 RepID=UPI000F51345C|nr:RteC domain-containing protein [Chryseobacterium sp. G0162]
MIKIEEKEQFFSMHAMNVIEEAYNMAVFLQELLKDLKTRILRSGFKNHNEEVFFFKRIKPPLLGKLIYYNKIFRIESLSPQSTEMFHIYYEQHIRILEEEFKEHIDRSDFHQYFRTERTDLDDKYFWRGKIDLIDGVNSFYQQNKAHYFGKASNIIFLHK